MPLTTNVMDSTASGMSPRKVAAIGAVILVHALFYYGFTHTSEMIKLVTPVTTMMVQIQEARPAPPPPPPAVPPPKQADLIPTPEPIEMPQVPVEPEVAAPLETSVDTSAISPPSDAPTTVALNSISIVHRNDPPYPPAERRAGHEGRVVLRVVIDTQGHPASVEIAQGSGYAALDDAAKTAVERWRFGGNKTGGLVSVSLPISFRIQ